MTKQHPNLRSDNLRIVRLLDNATTLRRPNDHPNDNSRIRVLESKKKWARKDRADNPEKYRRIAKVRHARNKDQYSNLNKKWNGKYPTAAAARRAVKCAIESGKISRASCCSKCGSARYVEAHHDDYSKPLDVRWLCRSCHRRAHAEQNAVYRILHDLPPAPKECAR